MTLSLSASDNVGVTQMKFRNDSGAWSSAEAYAATKSWTLNSGDGTKTVSVQFGDAAGNWSAAAADTIILDMTAPVTTASPGGGAYSAPRTVTLNAVDATSGVDKIYYWTDEMSEAIYTGPITISTTTTLYFTAKDKAGNGEGMKSATYTIP